MLKLVSNRNGAEIHQLEVTQDGCTITPNMDGVVDLIKDLNCDKGKILNALSQFNPDYVWAVTDITRALCCMGISICSRDCNAPW